ncbi:hypothetical protein, partial [Staphylococcus epidermidis]|uniref:hypothetical protein n=1 Tax=Staphylococcus epidermidis TaxID=1282 RepID=UPI0005165EA5
IWDADQQPLVFELPELSLQNALITSEVVVHRDETISLESIIGAMTLTDDRITSYNVCYTKLLRLMKL